ncbi:MAG: hypothetical protein FJ028_01450 [Chloroflexi bacterium]|nr:hypothetical protein [Chloroflexota bacterium]
MTEDGALPRVTDDERHMDGALAEARAAAGHGDVPIGAVVVRDGTVISRGRNRREADVGSRRAEVERLLAEFFAERRGPRDVEG